MAVWEQKGIYKLLDNYNKTHNRKEEMWPLYAGVAGYAMNTLGYLSLSGFFLFNIVYFLKTIGHIESSISTIRRIF